MSDILSRLRGAYTENPASALALLPELLQEADEGMISETTPSKVYLIEGWYCELCHKRHERIREMAVGKDVFLSRKAAEAALKERE
jgi:hypothetical protein